MTKCRALIFLGTEDTAENKRDPNPCLISFHAGGDIDNKQVKQAKYWLEVHISLANKAEERERETSGVMLTFHRGRPEQFALRSDSRVEM